MDSDANKDTGDEFSYDGGGLDDIASETGCYYGDRGADDRSGEDLFETTLYKYEVHERRTPEGGCYLETVAYFRNAPAGDSQVRPSRRCPDCNGTGSLLLLITTRPCKKCGGSGRLGVA